MPLYSNQGMGTGYTNWDTIFGLNKPGAQAMTAGIVNPINADANAFQQDATKYANAAAPAQAAGQPLSASDPQQYAKLQQRAEDIGQRAALASAPGGAESYLQRGRGAGYSGGMSGFDAALAGTGAGAGQLAAVGQYSNLPSIFASMRAPTVTSTATPSGMTPQEIRLERQRQNPHAQRANTYGME